MSRIRTRAGTFVNITDIAKAEIQPVGNTFAQVKVFDAFDGETILCDVNETMLPDAVDAAAFLNQLAYNRRRFGRGSLTYWEYAFSPIAKWLCEPPLTNAQRAKINAERHEAALAAVAKIQAAAE